MLSTNKLIIGTSRHLTERGYAYAGSGIGSIQGQARRSRSCPGQSLEPAGISSSLHASSGDERGPALEIQAVERTGASVVGEARARCLGQSAPTRVVGTAGPHGSDHRGINRSRGARSQEQRQLLRRNFIELVARGASRRSRSCPAPQQIVIRVGTPFRERRLCGALFFAVPLLLIRGQSVQVSSVH